MSFRMFYRARLFSPNFLSIVCKIVIVMGRKGRTIKEQNLLVRRLIKSQAPGVSVRASTGTAADWLDVSGTEDRDFRKFTPHEAKGLESLGLNVGRGRHPISISYDTKEWMLGKYGKYVKRPRRRR